MCRKRRMLLSQSARIISLVAPTGHISQSQNRTHNCLVHPALYTQQYFTPRPKTGSQVREYETGKVNHAPDLFGALAVCAEHRDEGSPSSRNGFALLTEDECWHHRGRRCMQVVAAWWAVSRSSNIYPWWISSGWVRNFLKKGITQSEVVPTTRYLFTTPYPMVFYSTLPLNLADDCSPSSDFTGLINRPNEKTDCIYEANVK